MWIPNQNHMKSNWSMSIVNVILRVRVLRMIWFD